jgi:hypothetical protein
MFEQKLRALIREAQDDIDWGGDEDEHGNLMPGEVDLDDLFTSIMKIYNEED